MALTIAFIIFILLSVGLIGLIVSIPELIEKDSKNKHEINKLNRLYECEKCNKYHREYQRIIAEKSDDNYKKVSSGKYKFENGKLIKHERINVFLSRWERTCPHCLYEFTSSVDEEYEWTKYHQDCPILDKKKYKTFTNMIAEIDRMAYEARSINKFMEKNNLV